MYLNDNIDVKNFFETLSKCSGEVTLHTAEGDILNMRSALSQFIFMVDFAKQQLLSNATVICSNSEDYKLLENFLNA